MLKVYFCMVISDLKIESVAPPRILREVRVERTLAAGNRVEVIGELHVFGDRLGAVAHGDAVARGDDRVGGRGRCV